MTTFDRIEPRLPELIDELAAARVPDYFDDMLRSTAAAKQRPAWSSPERWLPMGEIAQRLPGRQIPWRPIVLFATLVLIVTAGLLAYAGSRQRVPAPFGPAANGQLYFAVDGAIMAADPDTGATTRIATGETDVAYPLPSRDGTRIVFDRTSGGASQLFVAAVDGSAVRPLAGTYDGWTWTEWSPDDREIGIVSQIDGIQTVSILAADGSGQRVLPLDREVLSFWWLPEGGFVFTGAESPGDRCRAGGDSNRCALFVVGADGQQPRMLLDAAAFSGLSTSVSLDGTQVLYVRWADGDVGSLHVVDVATGQDRSVAFANRDPASDESNTAEFSPDGSLILFDRYQGSAEHFAVVPTAGGTVRNIGRAWDRPEGTLPEAHFSPDGDSVLAFYPTSSDGSGELWLLDVTGTGQDRRIDVPVPYLPAWQRTAP